MISEKFYVGYSDINKEFELSNTAILKHFQNLTTIHGALVNDSLLTSDYAWFLTAYHVKIFNRPKYESWVTYSTWSTKIKGFLASREFEIRDDNENLMLSALANYVRVNKTTQKIERISSDIISGYGENEKTNFNEVWIPKLNEGENLIYEKEYFIDRNFIDVNNHVNNVSYLELANLALPEEVYKEKESLEFEIMYKKAVKCYQTIKCKYYEESNHYIVAAKSLDDTELFAIIKFYKNN